MNIIGWVKIRDGEVLANRWSKARPEGEGWRAVVLLSDAEDYAIECGRDGYWDGLAEGSGDSR